MCPDNVVVGGHVVHQAGQVELPLLLDVEVVGVPQEADRELQHCQPAPGQPYSNSETRPGGGISIKLTATDSDYWNGTIISALAGKK